MERPLEDATTANLWKTLFALIVELSLRSGLVTEEELIPALATPPGNEIQSRVSSRSNASQVDLEEGEDANTLWYKDGCLIFPKTKFGKIFLPN